MKSQYFLSGKKHFEDLNVQSQKLIKIYPLFTPPPPRDPTPLIVKSYNHLPVKEEYEPMTCNSVTAHFEFLKKGFIFLQYGLFDLISGYAFIL